MSERGVVSFPWACSGERYWAVPITEPVAVMSELSPRAIPKSATRARPSASIRTFCGFRSRWTIPLRWAKRAALRIWRVKSIASFVLIPPLTRSLSWGPSTYSIAMK
jgi:hypothetical protein